MWTCKMPWCKLGELEVHAKRSLACDLKQTLANVSSMSHNECNLAEFEMAGGYTKDITKPENCQNGGQVHAQEWAVALLE